MPAPALLRMLVSTALALAGVRLTVAAPERCDPVPAATAREAAYAAAEWLVANQRADGSYLYLADESGRDLGDYNSVRHAGVTLSLFQAARAGGDTAMADAADRALDWMLDRVARRDGWVALADGRSASLGGAALMLAALAERREMSGDSRHDETMRALGRFLVAMQRDNGDFGVSVDLQTGAVDPGATSPYFPGEALWALARLERALPDPQWRDAALAAARYLALVRDDRDHVPVPPLNDHWASYGYAEMADWPHVTEPLPGFVADHARSIHARFHLLTRWEAQGQAGRPYSWTHGPQRRAAALGTWVEGQAALARFARADDRLADLGAATLDSTRCGAAVLVARQRADADPRVDGAWFNDGETRMDDQQHAISGLLALAELLEGAP